jgi:hypothetical protein
VIKEIEGLQTFHMKPKLIVLLILVSAICLLSFIANRFQPDIPKVWDDEALHSMHLPYPDSSIHLKFLSEEEYRKLPERVSYKTYPFYLPGTEPKGYYDSLSKLDPVVNFRPEDLKTEEDWVKAGETIYDMPMLYTVIDSTLMKMLPTLGQRWKAAGIMTTSKGVVPFVSLSIRKKGVIELAGESCGMCHTRLMPNDQILKGGQGNFIADVFRNIRSIASPAFRNASPEDRKKQFLSFNYRLYGAPWITNDYLYEYKKVDATDTVNSPFRTQLPGVQTRGNTSFNHPISIPDLYNLKDRKYLDKTGHNRNRGIADIMRYSTLNQNLMFSTSYGGFIPDTGAIRIEPDYRRVGRFSEAQLYALAKYLYTLKPPANPDKFSPALLAKGKEIFVQQGCATCHTPPLYSNNKLTPVDGFEPPASHFKEYSIFNVSVGTDPRLSLYTRRGSGYYKIPSLIGAWNRTAFLHDGHLATLEDLFDTARFSPHYKPTYYKPLGVEEMAVPGHPFGTDLNPGDKKALIAFVKSL